MAQSDLLPDSSPHQGHDASQDEDDTHKASSAINASQTSATDAAAPPLAPEDAASHEANPGGPMPAPDLATDDSAPMPASSDTGDLALAKPASPSSDSAAFTANASMTANNGTQAGTGTGNHDASLATPANPTQTPASAPASAPGWLANWPRDTRLRYHLSGNYRGELHGSAEVLWQREGDRYQAIVQLDVGLLLTSRFTSQGHITAQGLRPEVYEEQVRQRRRGVRLDSDSVQLHQGERVPRPPDVQDTASQFVELGHRFATGQIALAPGKHINFWLARPNHVDAWTYDVIAEETLHLPRLGAVQAFHLKPRPLERPSSNVSAEIWFAPSLQYLPVRIRLSQGEETHMDLIVQTVEQR